MCVSRALSGYVCVDKSGAVLASLVLVCDRAVGARPGCAEGGVCGSALWDILEKDLDSRH